MRENFSMIKESKSVGKFSIHLSVLADRIFRVLLAMVLCCQQITWAMDDPNRGSNLGPRLSTRGSVLGLEGSLEESLLSAGENVEREEANISFVPVPLKPKEGFTQEPFPRHIEMSPLANATPREFLDEEAALNKLSTIEKSLWKGSLRWANVDNLLQRLGYSLTLRNDEVTQTDDQKRFCSSPVWLSGGSFPVRSERARKYILFVDGLRQGAEFIIWRALETGIIALTFYQLHNYLDQKTPLLCQSPSLSHNTVNIFDFLINSDEQVLLGVFHDVLGYQSGVLPYLKSLLVAPFVWGTIKGLWNTRKSSLSSEEISELIQEIGILKPSFGRDTLRWLLPLHPLDQRLNFLMKNFLWNPSVSAEDLQKIWKCLETLSTDHHGYTPINALARVMSITFGLNTRDAKAFSKKPPFTREDEKKSKYNFLNTMDDRTKIKDQAFFFLQEMANFNRTKQKETFSKKFQTGMTALYAKYLLWSLGFPRTPTELIVPTLFKAGKLYLEARLFQAIITALLKAESCPEQPGVSVAGVEPWASDLTQECFEAFLQTFNIIPGQPVETLIGNLDQYYFPNCTIDLDLSNKGLSGQTIANIIRALLNHNITFTSLDLSGNAVNTPEDFEAIFPILDGVTHLDLSQNHIGQGGSNGTLLLGQRLSNLTRLTSLDLSQNLIGHVNSNGAVALAQGLSKLTRLTSLALWNNQIGNKDSHGVAALGHALSDLTQLTSLNLHSIDIGYTDSDGTVALGQGLSNLTQLTSLDLSVNWIGYTDSNGTRAVGQGLSNLTQLTSLTLSSNYIGSTDSKGTIALGRGLSNLIQLTSLDLSSNVIDHNDLKSLVKSLYDLHKLQTFEFLPNPVTNTDIAEINKALNHTLVNSLPTVISSTTDAIIFCQSLLPSNQSCDLSYRMPSPSSLTIKVLLQCLQGQTQLTSLDLSQNHIGQIDSEGTVALGQGLSNLTQLISLDLSFNKIGWTDSNGTVALGLGLSSLTQLASLDLSQNSIGWTDSNGTVALAQGLSSLTQLASLDLSATEIGRKDSRGMTALGQRLSKLTRLTSLDLSSNWIGWTDSNGTVALAQGLSSLTRLTSLDLSTNYIGYTDSDGTVTLGRGLNQTRSLEMLNLAGNFIGSTGPEGPQVLIPVLLSLPNLKLENLNVQGMTNISWTQAASYLQHNQSKAMMQSCQTSKCHGGTIHVSPSSSQESLVSSFLSYATGNTTYLERSPASADPAKSRALVVYDETMATSIETDTLSILGVSALSGAVFAVLPEALGDALHLSCMVSERNAYHVKRATNAALVFATGSWLPVGASWIASTGLQYMGCSESKARIGGNAVGFLVNTGRVLTPTGIAAVAANYVAGRLGLWAEKNMMKSFFSKTQAKGLGSF